MLRCWLNDKCFRCENDIWPLRSLICSNAVILANTFKLPFLYFHIGGAYFHNYCWYIGALLALHKGMNMFIFRWILFLQSGPSFGIIPLKSVLVCCMYIFLFTLAFGPTVSQKHLQNHKFEIFDREKHWMEGHNPLMILLTDYITFSVTSTHVKSYLLNCSGFGLIWEILSSHITTKINISD